MKQTSSSGITAASLLKAAKVAERLEKQRAAVAESESLLASLIGTPITGAAPQVIPTRKGAKRTMSEATKAKIAAGQKARWAKQNSAAPAPVTAAPAPAPKAPVTAVV